MTIPTVTVVIPTFNRRHSLGRAIASVLDQTFQGLELLVVDDGSTDDTPKVVSAISDPRLRYVRLCHNVGASAARNRGIAEAQGEFLAFLDSDDRWHPKKLEKQLDVFSHAPDEVGLVRTGLQHLTSTGQIQRVSIPYHSGLIFSRQLAHNWTGSSSLLLVRRCVLEKIGGWDECLPSCQDWDLGIRISKICAIESIPEILVDIVVDGRRITSDLSAQRQGMLKVVAKYQNDVRSQPSEVRASAYSAYAQGFWQRRLWGKAVEYMARSLHEEPRYAVEYVHRAGRKACRFARRRSGIIT